MTAKLFLVLVTAMSALGIAVAWRSLSRTAAWVVTLGLAAWLAYVGALGWFGILRDPAMRPPGTLWLFTPVVLFMVIFAVRSSAARRVALVIRLALLVGAQVYRVALPGFLAPLAVLLHVIAIRAVRARVMRSARVAAGQPASSGRPAHP